MFLNIDCRYNIMPKDKTHATKFSRKITNKTDRFYIVIPKVILNRKPAIEKGKIEINKDTLEITIDLETEFNGQTAH